MGKRCGVDYPLKEICKDTKNCALWSDSVGCTDITPNKICRS